MSKKKGEKLAEEYLTTDGHSVEEILADSDEAFGVSLAAFGEVDVFSTGNLIIDNLIGVGGLPRGRITELFGPPSSGKTTTALQAAASAQELGHKIAYLDFENDLDEDYCAALGLDTSAEAGFIHAEPPSLEKGANLMRALIRANDAPALFIIDSVAAMTTDAEAMLATGDRSGVAERARLMAQLLRQIRGPVKKANCAVVFINHIQEKIDMSPMGQQMARRGIKQYTTPGGEALKFYSSLRIQYKQAGNRTTEEVSEITNTKERTTVATKTKVKIAKNKLAPPNREAMVTVRYGRGFAQAQAVLDVLVAYTAVKRKSGGWHVFPPSLAPAVDEDGHMLVQAKLEEDGSVKIQGEDATFEALDLDREWLSRCTAYAERLIEESKVKEGAA